MSHQHSVQAHLGMAAHRQYSCDAVSKQSASIERVHPRAWTEISVECPPEISGLKVLVVDDDADTCEMIRFVLEQCGGVVTTVADAESAMEAFHAPWYHVPLFRYGELPR